MDRTTALELIRNEAQLKKLIEINCFRYEVSRTYSKCCDLCSELSDPVFQQTQLFKHRFKQSDFVCFQSDYDMLIMLEPVIIRELLFFLGSCVISQKLKNETSADVISLYRRTFGEGLFSFIYFYAIYAPYAKDMKLDSIIDEFTIDQKNINKVIEMAGTYVLHKISLNFSSDVVRKVFIQRSGMRDFFDVARFFGMSSVNVGCQIRRVFSLVKLFLKNKGLAIL